MEEREHPNVLSLPISIEPRVLVPYNFALYPVQCRLIPFSLCVHYVLSTPSYKDPFPNLPRQAVPIGMGDLGDKLLLHPLVVFLHVLFLEGSLLIRIVPVLGCPSVQIPCRLSYVHGSFCLWA